MAHPIKNGVVIPAGIETFEVSIPAFTNHEKGGGQLRRQCTKDWKIKPIRRLIKPLLEHKEQAELWLGISTDEVQRAKDSDVKYLKHTYPLLDKNMSRADCVTFLRSRGLEIPPKSACHFCPFHNKKAWEAMKRENGSGWQNALQADELIRNARPGKGNYQLYLHSSGKPLNEAVRILEDDGMRQASFDLEEATCDSGHCFI